MADYGEKPTLVPALDFREEWQDTEWALCYSMGQSIFVPTLYMRGEQSHIKPVSEFKELLDTHIGGRFP